MKLQIAAAAAGLVGALAADAVRVAVINHRQHIAALGSDVDAGVRLADERHTELEARLDVIEGVFPRLANVPLLTVGDDGKARMTFAEWLVEVDVYAERALARRRRESGAAE